MGLLGPFGYFVLLLLCYKNSDGQMQARPVPLCIKQDDPLLAKNPQYAEFMPILKNANSYYKSAPLTETSNPIHKVLDSIIFSNIKLDVSKLKFTDSVLVDKALGNGNIFQQWLHISVKAKVPMRGLIVQAMHGPIGIPFGNFRDFKGLNSVRCQCSGARESVNNFIAFPCTYKPKAALTHPDVFTFHADYRWPREETNPKQFYGPIAPTTEIDLNFQFTDITCHRASTFKFLVLAVASFNPPNVEVLSTVTYKNDIPFSIDGVPYPFHTDFCGALLCDHTPINFQRSMQQLRTNLEYDTCVQAGPVTRGDISCPPGPFRCETTPTTTAPSGKAAEDLLTQEAIIYTTYSSDPDCTTVCKGPVTGTGIPDPPTATEDTLVKPLIGGSEDGMMTGGSEGPKPPNWVDTSVEEPLRADNDTDTGDGTEGNGPDGGGSLDPEGILATELGAIAGARARALHGILMFFAFSISGSISMFLARFDKDMCPGGGCCAKGIWLWGHILQIIVSLATMWAGIFVLEATDENSTTWALEPLHILFGVVAMLLFHSDFLFGWTRPIGRTFRGLYISLHSIFGYASKITGAIAMLIVPAGVFPIIVVLLAEFVNIAFYALSTCVQCKTDTRMGMKGTDRKVCPYTEGKPLKDPVPPTCGRLRNLLLFLQIGSLIVIFIIAAALWQSNVRVRLLMNIPGPRNYANLTQDPASKA